MTFSIHCKNINELIQEAVSWAQRESSGVFNGTSADAGMLRLVAREFIPVDGVFYSAIEISNIKIPKRQRRQGLYTMLLKGLDSLDKFGVRLHNTTGNDWLIEHHRRHGYSEDKFGGNSPSFSLIIGTPLDVEKQHQLQQIFPSKKFSRRKPGSGGLIPRKC